MKSMPFLCEASGGHPALYWCLQSACYHVEPKKYLEIGVRDGDSALCVINSASIEQYVGIDTWGSSDGGSGRGTSDFAYKRIVGGSNGTNVMLLTGQSGSVLRGEHVRSSAPFDLILIDGCHHPDFMREDVILSWELLRSGGAIVVDEYGRLYQGNPFLRGIAHGFFEQLGVHPTLAYWDDENGAAMFLKPEKTCA